MEAVFDAEEELRSVPRLSADAIARLRGVSLDAIEEELAALVEKGLRVVTWDDDYPANLRGASDAPPLLFAQGELRPEDANAVAIVGTRADAHGRGRGRDAGV